MTGKHTIDIDEMMAWLDKHWVCYARDSAAAKAFETNAGMMEVYRVTHAGKEVYKGSNIETAVKTYNEI